MEDEFRQDDSSAGPLTLERPDSIDSRLRCAICERRLGNALFFVEETGDVPEPRGSWVLCAACNDAVHEQMERAQVRSPLRLRIAIGVVASDRTPKARREHFGQLTDDGWAKLLIWLFPLTMLVHLAIIVAIAGLIK
ncbi:MAG: hypothetical protein OJF49_000171 [Ktedonobacterales bacterium]|jgi:hypothetical protein|nr:MAG: hypothetical protein OJF49_000171 [Ktedonobacterales bacterium]